MGNEQSDKVEKKVHRVVKWVPLFGNIYSGVRAGVYAGKGNKSESLNSLINTIPYVGPITTEIIDQIDVTPTCETRIMTKDDSVWNNTFDS